MIRYRSVQWLPSISLGLLATFCVLPEAISQDVVIVKPGPRYPWRVRWADYDPYYAITTRVYAQADLIRAQGDAAESFARARSLNADAYSKELDNWMKELRVFWDRKIVAEQKQLELDHVRQISKLRYLNDQKWRNSRIWDRLKNHPELSDGSIKEGKALNFMLARLAATALPYQYSPGTSRFGEASIDQLRLNEQLLDNILLKNGPFRFPASQTMQESINLWPYLLRREEFNGVRESFEAARMAVVRASETEELVPVETIEEMHQALIKLTNEFHRSTDTAAWVKEHKKYSHFRQADRFLLELDREITRLEETGDIRPFRGRSGYDPEVDGQHLIAFLCFMNRNGVEFAPAEPGNEFAYRNLFVMMRALYLTVAEEDASLQPQDLRTLTN